MHCGLTEFVSISISPDKTEFLHPAQHFNYRIQKCVFSECVYLKEHGLTSSRGNCADLRRNSVSHDSKRKCQPIAAKHTVTLINAHSGIRTGKAEITAVFEACRRTAV